MAFPYEIRWTSVGSSALRPSLVGTGVPVIAMQRTRWNNVNIRLPSGKAIPFYGGSHLEVIDFPEVTTASGHYRAIEQSFSFVEGSTYKFRCPIWIDEVSVAADRDFLAISVSDATTWRQSVGIRLQDAGWRLYNAFNGISVNQVSEKRFQYGQWYWLVGTIRTTATPSQAQVSVAALTLDEAREIDASFADWDVSTSAGSAGAVGTFVEVGIIELSDTIDAGVMVLGDEIVFDLTDLPLPVNLDYARRYIEGTSQLFTGKADLTIAEVYPSAGANEDIFIYDTALGIEGVSDNNLRAILKVQSAADSSPRPYLPQRFWNGCFVLMGSGAVAGTRGYFEWKRVGARAYPKDTENA